MSASKKSKKKSLNIDDLANKLTSIKGKIDTKTKGFNFKNLAHEDNTVKGALDYIDFIDQTGKDGVKDDLDALANDIQYVSQFHFNDAIREFRDSQKLDTYKFEGESHQERARFARDLMASLLAQSLETQSKLYKNDIHEELVKQLKKKDVDDDVLQDAVKLIFSYRTDKIPNIHQLINEIAKYLENGGDFSLQGVQDDDFMKTIYGILATSGLTHVEGIREKPLQYLVHHGDHEEGKEEISKYVVDKVAGDEYKGKISLKPTATANIDTLIKLINSGRDGGWRNKKGLGKAIKKHADYKAIKHKEVYR